MAAWLSDPVIVSGLNGTGVPMTKPMLDAYIAGFDNVRKNLAVLCDGHNDLPIGLVTFDIEPRHRIGTFHILIGGSEGRRRDAAYCAVRMLLKHMFTVRSVEKISIEPLSRNRAVVRNCLWLGLRLEGILIAHRLDSKDGKRLDQHVFGLTKDEYRNWPHRLA